MTPASPYSGKFAGYRIAQGKLNLDLAYDIAGRSLKSKNVITLDRFTFGDKVESPDATHLPVRLAIALLKDRNGQILLDVPVEGSLDDPKFRVGKVVWHTVLNILEKAATSPFSLLGALVGGGGEELSYQDFAPGSAGLSPASEKKLDSLAKALYERPGLQLEIAGSIDPEADRDGLRRASLDKEIRTRQWTSLRKSERATTTPGQITLTPEQHTDWVKKLYSEAVGKGVINSAFLVANTNLAAIAAQIPSRSGETEKDATLLIQRSSAIAPKSSKAARPFQSDQTRGAFRPDGGLAAGQHSRHRQRPRSARVRPRQSRPGLHPSDGQGRSRAPFPRRKPVRRCKNQWQPRLFAVQVGNEERQHPARHQELCLGR